MHLLPKTVISSASNTYAKKPKRLGILGTAIWAAKKVIFTYSNILLSVSMINITRCVCVGSQERPLRLFEVLARNRQSAVELWAVRKAHKIQPNRMFTIPPRQQLSISHRGWSIRRRRRYTPHKHIQTNKAFFNRDTHIQYTEMFALLKLFFFLF